MNSETGDIKRFLDKEQAKKAGYNIPLTEPLAAELLGLPKKQRLAKAEEIGLMPPTHLKRGEQAIGGKVYKKRSRVSR